MRAALILLLLAVPFLPAAAADEVYAETPVTPLCDLTANVLACSQVWVRATTDDAECLVLMPTPLHCLETWCTLDHPPSYCGNRYVSFGFHR